MRACGSTSSLRWARSRTFLRPDAKERVDSDSAWFRYEGEIVQITDISASPEREG
jgi:hypothetical protein